jgi:hypothetical protein
VLPWHYLNRDYLDDDQTLCSRINDRFEVEANLFAAEVVFQGERFRDVARQYRPEFASIFELARLHGASKHATFWRFVEVHDESVAGIVYYPSRRDSSSQNIHPEFLLQNVVRSARFCERFGNVNFDGHLDFRHEWAQARLSVRQPVLGEMPLVVNDSTQPFLWEAFWNGYCLMVLLRRRPPLRLVAGLIRRVPWG